jgi:molybdopterin-guanine dinucleotide biosynthesis protein A
VVSSVPVTGIVLAGGRSTRFGADKLAVHVGGRPLLHRAILAAAAVSDEVVVVIGANGARPPLPADADVRVRVVRDALADGGPLAGLAAGLAGARGRLAILVGGDQPSLSPAVLGELLLWLGRDAAGPPLDAVALAEDGLLRPLPAALRVATSRPVAEALLRAGSRSLNGLFECLRVGTLEPERWRILDPEGASLRDIDTPDDLPGR